MRPTWTAILRLHEPAAPAAPDGLARSLRRLRGVIDSSFDEARGVVTVTFEHALTSIPDIVRTIEDQGHSVASVTRRSRPERAERDEVRSDGSGLS